MKHWFSLPLVGVLVGVASGCNADGVVIAGGVGDSKESRKAEMCEGFEAPEYVASEAVAETFPQGVVQHVVAVSVDGLAAWALEPMIEAGELPAFAALQLEGAWTHNARTDATRTVTLPNHTTMLTALPAEQTVGLPAWQAHGYVDNSLPPEAASLHNGGNPELGYVPSAFDVVHDRGLSTAFYASKTKFVLFEQTYNFQGRSDQDGDDNGQAKIDEFAFVKGSDAATDDFVEALQRRSPNFSFLHLAAPDKAGHASGWGSEAWQDAVRLVDAQIAKLMQTIECDGRLSQQTVLIITTDHGGGPSGHANEEDPRNFRIPFYVWGPGTIESGDLYEWCSGRCFPAAEGVLPGYASHEQPIRNGDLANLSLSLLELPPVPGSLIRSLRAPERGQVAYRAAD